MAKRRVKKRTHVGAPGKPNNVPKPEPSGGRAPKSMVIRIGAGEVGPSVSQLVKDVRHMMEPGTASRLKERRSNKLRDYTTMAGPLGVSHLLLFSRSDSGNTNLRLAITPRGPTLHFRVEKYSLCKDIARSMKHPKAGGGKEHLVAPLLVMNNFVTPASAQPSSKVPKHLENLTTSVFQSLFPPISPQTTPLGSIKRVLLLDRTAPDSHSPDQPYTIQLRHFSISTKVVNLSRGLKRLDRATKLLHPNQNPRKGRGTLPNLGKLGDVADYLLDPAAAGYTSASESEVDTDAEVEVLQRNARKVLGKRERQQLTERRAVEQANGDNNPRPRESSRKANVQKRGIKLTELGPRMTLRLMKLEEGVCAGKVMWHESITKTKAEENDLDRLWERRKQEKEARKKLQRENVEKKRKERHEAGEVHSAEGAELLSDMDDDEWDSEALDAEGEEADEGNVKGEGEVEMEELEEDVDEEELSEGGVEEDDNA